MSGNIIGHIFKLNTFGESHGECIGGIIDGVPSGLKICEQDLQIDLDRRKPGKSIYTSERKESDKVKILSGIFEGKTTGTSIGIIINNEDKRTRDYRKIKNIFRPGHADYTYEKKYGFRDYRGGGRSSARETAIRVAAGAIAKKYLSNACGAIIRGFISQVGNIKCNFQSWDQVEKNDFFCPDKDCVNKLEHLILKLKNKGDSVGAKITIVAQNVPYGLGEPVFNKLDADIAHALMSINAVKGVEIGDGFKVVSKLGSENVDAILETSFSNNYAGGILGGISSGQDIVAHIALKPTPSILMPVMTKNKYGKIENFKIEGRHDPCVGIRAVPIAEAMMAITIMDHFLLQRIYS